MSNIRDVAREAGVSVATVSRALSDPDKVSQSSLNKVHQAIDKVGYRPNMLARSFRSAKSYAVVVLVPDITNPFFSQVIRSIEDRAQQKGYAVLLGDTRGLVERERDYIRRVETRLADGVIQLRPDQVDKHIEIPSDVICVNACGCESTRGPRVRIDNTGAARSLVDYLIGLGHRRIGVISGLENNPHSLDRLAGYRQALAAAGIEFDRSLIVEGDFTMESGRLAAQPFCTMPTKPTALFCMNDEMAIGAIQTLKQHGLRVPEDISVTGFDDISYARYCDPSLTTVAQPAEAIGKIAMDMLLGLIAGEPLAPQQRVLPAELVVRASTAAPRAD